MVFTLEGHPSDDICSCRLIYLKNNILVSASDDDNHIKLWDLDKKCLKVSLKVPENSSTGVINIEDEYLALLRKKGGYIKLWDIKKSVAIKPINWDNKEPRRNIVKYVNCGNGLMAAIIDDGDMEIWDTKKDFSLIYKIMKHDHDHDGNLILQLINLKDGLIATICDCGKIEIWNTNNLLYTKHEPLLNNPISFVNDILQKGLETGDPIFKFVDIGHVGNNLLLLKLSGSRYCSLYIWNFFDPIYFRIQSKQDFVPIWRTRPLWDLKNKRIYEPVINFKINNCNIFYYLKYLGNGMIVSSCDGGICVIDLYREAENDED